MNQENVRVEAVRSLAELEPLRAALDALNGRSRRPCAFSTFEYIRSMLLHDEFAVATDRLLVLCGYRGEELIGYLPLRSSRARVLGLPFRKVTMLVSHDTDRPHVVARGEDEQACCAAFFRHLAGRERWSSLELAFQDEESRLWPPPLSPWRFHCRRFENLPSITIPLQAKSIGEFYRSFPGEFRNTVGRMSRRLFRAGRVEVISSQDPRASRPLLDLYMDVERRSWKVAARAGISRHPERLAFFQSLCEPDQKLKLAHDLILLDGVPVAGMVSGTFEDRFYAFETTYDSAYADLSPGYLTWLMAIRHGLVQGLRSYNLQSAYSYYKERWSGVSTPTWAVQVFRIPSLPFFKARAGAWKRRLFGGASESLLYNEAKRSVEAKPSGEPGARPDRSAEAALAARILVDLERTGVALERLSGDALAGVLPFDVDSRPRQ